jgi:hypothetical protein
MNCLIINAYSLDFLSRDFSDNYEQHFKRLKLLTNLFVVKDFEFAGKVRSSIISFHLHFIFKFVRRVRVTGGPDTS